MNDMTSNSASVAPPSSSPAPSAPESPAPSAPLEAPSQEMLEVLTAPEDVSQYAEERHAQEGQTEQQATEPKKRLNRYERLRKARDAAQAEAAALKAQGTGPRGDDGRPENLHEQLHPEEYAAAEQQADTNGQAPPEGEGYAQTPEEAAEAREALRQQMIRESDIAADYRARERAVAAALPDYRQTIEAAADIDIGPTAVQLLRQSEHGPFIAYALARTVDGQEILHALKDADPLQVAAFVAKAEAQIEHGNRQRAMRQRQPQQPQQPQRRVATNAPRPVGYLKGSAGPTRTTAELADNGGMDITAYAAKRLPQLRKDR